MRVSNAADPSRDPSGTWSSGKLRRKVEKRKVNNAFMEVWSANGKRELKSEPEKSPETDGFFKKVFINNSFYSEMLLRRKGLLRIN